VTILSSPLTAGCWISGVDACSSRASVRSGLGPWRPARCA